MPLSTRITYATLAANRTISTGSLKVSAIILTNTTAAIVDITITNAAGTTLMVVTVPADNTLMLAGAAEWLFDAGMIVNSESANSHVMVFHSQDGA